MELPAEPLLDEAEFVEADDDPVEAPGEDAVLGHGEGHAVGGDALADHVEVGLALAEGGRRSGEASDTNVT